MTSSRFSGTVLKDFHCDVLFTIIRSNFPYNNDGPSSIVSCKFMVYEDLLLYAILSQCEKKHRIHNLV